VTTTYYAYVARPILSSYPLPGFPVPVVTIEDDPRQALLDELDSLIADLATVLAERDAARAGLAAQEGRCTIVSERLALVRHALEQEAGR
jgi:hypothetical protein